MFPSFSLQSAVAGRSGRQKKRKEDKGPVVVVVAEDMGSGSRRSENVVGAHNREVVVVAVSF